MKNLYYKKEIVAYLKEKAIAIIEEIIGDESDMLKITRIDGMLKLIRSVEKDVQAEEKEEKAVEDAKKAAVETAYDPEL